MTSQVSQLKEAGARGLVVSEQGEAWLEANPEFIELVGQVCQQRRPEDALRDYSDIIGIGDHSVVRNLAGVAIKVSSRTTGRPGYRTSPGRPENLIGQFSFLSALGTYLKTKPDALITTPEQYLAFRTPPGGFLKVEQYMDGWIGLGEFSAKQGWLYEDREKGQYLNATAKKRIKSTVQHPVLRHGLNGLGLDYKGLHTGNILTYPSEGDLDSLPLCIIDQPKTRQYYLGKLSVLLMHETYSSSGAT